MATSQRETIVIEDDDNDDLEFLNCKQVAPSKAVMGKNFKSKLLSKASPSKALIFPLKVNQQSQLLMAHNDSPQVRSPFTNASWTFESASITPKISAESRGYSQLEERRSRSRTLSTEASRIFAPSPSPMSQTRVRASQPGSSSAPIELEESENDFRDKSVRPTGSPTEIRYQNTDGSYSLIQRRKLSKGEPIISLDEDEEFTMESGPVERTDALSRSMRRHLTQDDELIDLEDIEGFEEIEEREFKELQVYNPELQLLRVDDVYRGDLPVPRRRSSKSKSQVYRNPVIDHPFYTVESYEYKKSTLKPKKTVELRDGDFLRIKHIILSQESGQVTLRGHRLQRVRDLNGMLEKKINEVCLFHEVDLDDPRDAEEQSAVEVPVDEVVRIRVLRSTNQTFPLCRNIILSDFRNKEEVAVEGGLTVRWKYTCKYATAADRHCNIYRERTLEHIRADESTGDFKISDRLRRLEWRGETIRGGAYQPATESIRQVRGKREGSHISIDSDDSDPGIRHVQPVQFRSSFKPGSCYNPLGISCNASAKRKFSSSGDFSRLSASKQSTSEIGPKRARYEAEEEKVENTRRRLSRISLEIERSDSTTVSVVIDLSSDEQTVCFPLSTPPAKSLSSSGLITPPETGIAGSISQPNSPSVIIPVDQDLIDQSPCPSPLPKMNLVSSELSNPPPRGSITSNSTPAPIARSPGQMLTFGDAFCGAGGATRGAVMAGLRVKWGFDFWDHACSTWTANFPYATCYYLAAHQFVEEARQATRDGRPDIMKVDIVHLSPPCQYFSPAHTINGADDEMNVASLFAVQEVIEVARPRIVTLEQTFGIVSVRFRYYFAALINMFTSHDFSVRWAIIPLAQWGLPQRRFRLIIIASCPGEILPRMPAATHSDTDTDTLKAFVTVNRTLASIPHNATDHNPDPLTFSNRRLRSWDGNAILPRTMTTSGGQNYHPSGKRDFTLREYASLQGFPLNHVFRGTGIKKQIGNAVPPCVAKVLFESIKRDLDRADGIEEMRETVVLD